MQKQKGVNFWLYKSLQTKVITRMMYYSVSDRRAREKEIRVLLSGVISSVFVPHEFIHCDDNHHRYLCYVDKFCLLHWPLQCVRMVYWDPKNEQRNEIIKEVIARVVKGEVRPEKPVCMQ